VEPCWGSEQWLPRGERVDARGERVECAEHLVEPVEDHADGPFVVVFEHEDDRAVEVGILERRRCHQQASSSGTAGSHGTSLARRVAVAASGRRAPGGMNMHSGV
jgi:hypothetical protein